jgi:hypothetical protein
MLSKNFKERTEHDGLSKKNEEVVDEVKNLLKEYIDNVNRIYIRITIK